MHNIQHYRVSHLLFACSLRLLEDIIVTATLFFLNEVVRTSTEHSPSFAFEAIAIRWRPSLLGWRPSLFVWRPLLLYSHMNTISFCCGCCSKILHERAQCAAQFCHMFSTSNALESVPQLLFQTRTCPIVKPSSAVCFCSMHLGHKCSLCLEQVKTSHGWARLVAHAETC